MGHLNARTEFAIVPYQIGIDCEEAFRNTSVIGAPPHTPPRTHTNTWSTSGMEHAEYSRDEHVPPTILPIVGLNPYSF